MVGHLGKKIKKLRELNNFSQNYMAKKLNISQPSYSNLESGVDDISEERLEKIAELLKVEVSDIENFDDRAILNIIQHNIKSDGYVNNKYVDDRVVDLLNEKNSLLQSNVKLLEEKIHHLEKELAKANQENELLKAKVK
jgi:transcriptional regulator with XRE-family HTH domain